MAPADARGLFVLEGPEGQQLALVGFGVEDALLTPSDQVRFRVFA